MEDSKIIELLFARNEDGIKQIDDTYGRRLFTLADNIVRNDQDAEESVSDTYMKAWDTIPPKKPMHLFAYLAKVCRNFALKKLDWKAAAKRNAEVVSLTRTRSGTEKSSPESWGEFWMRSCGHSATRTRWFFCGGIGSWIPSQRSQFDMGSARVPCKCG